jgi:predicted permease
VINRLLQYLFQFVSQIWRRLLSLLRRRRYEREMEEEMRFHLEMQIEQNLDAGIPAEEARYAARRQFGNQTWLKEVSREMWSLRFIETLVQDLRYGARMLMKNSGFTLVAVSILALGVGANTAIFSVVNATLLRPLPYKDPDRIVMVWGTNPGGYGWRGKSGFSAPSFLDYQQRNQVFERIAAFHRDNFTLTGTRNPEFIRAGAVTPEFFDVLAVQPILGRTFLPQEMQTGQERVAVLSYGLWSRRFASDPSIIGQTTRLDGAPYTIIGVLPQGFDFTIPDFFQSGDLWVPAVLPRDNSVRGNKYLNVIARLKPGVSLGGAEQDMRAITGRLAREYPLYMGGFGVKLIPLHEQIFGDVRLVLLLLFGSVGFVLLIACANVANLQLARASTRRKEIAIRTALGASKRRVLRQLLTESLLLALIGGTLGLLLASWGIRLLMGLGLAGMPQGTMVRVDSTALAYSMALSLITGILFGLAPALQSTPNLLSESLKEGGRHYAASESGLRLRRLLTVSEVALSMILLIGAGLLIRSFVGLLRVNPGFETKNILTMRFGLPNYSYPDATKQVAFYTQLMERIKAFPGVIAVGATDELPPTMGQHSNSFSIEGRAPIDQSNLSLAVQSRMVSTDYFRVMGIPIVAGRVFSDADAASAAPVALINQSFAHRFFPNESPIGQRLRFRSANPWMTIVGIVGDVRGFGLDKQPSSEIYLFYQQQSPLPYNTLSSLRLVVRTADDPNSIASAALGAVRELDKDLPLPQARTMETVLAASVAGRRSNMLLLGVFAAIALILTGVGIYGVISYSVAQRTQEIGVRIALGAQSRDVTTLVLRTGMRLVLMGIAIGSAGAFALTRSMKSLLFEVSATDSLTFIMTALLLTAIALLACYIPARRATKVDPMVALRTD